MLAFSDQMERAMDSLDGVMHKMLWPVIWLLDIQDREDPKSSNLPDIIKDLSKPSMTFRDLQPDIISSNQENACCTRRKSLGDIHKNRVNSLIIEEHRLNRSLCHLDEVQNRLRVSHPAENETDIELQDHLSKSPSPPLCLRCSSNPFPSSTVESNNLDNDEIDGEPVQNEPHLATENFEDSQESPNSNAPRGQQQGIPEEAKIRLQRRITELFDKHIIMPQVSDKETDEQLCHDLVAGLKDIADSFDQRNSGKSTSQILRETFKINVPKLLVPGWLQNGIVPSLAKTTVDTVLQYNRL